MVGKDFSQVKLIKNSSNSGFGTANNQAVKISKGEWILLLNSDTKFTENTIKKLLDTAANASDPKRTIIGPKLLNQDGSTQQSAGHTPTLTRIFGQMLFLDDLPIIKKLISSYQVSDTAKYQNEFKPDWVTGACILVPRDAFQKVGGFDEKIFMYGEEVDLCLRLRKLGYQVIFTPKTQLFHLRGKSSKDGQKAAILGEFQGLVYLYQKHFPAKLPLLKLILKTGALLRILIFGIINQQKSQIYVQALKLI
jgi:hypothetical protein